MAAIQKYVPVAVGIKGGLISSMLPESVRLSPGLQSELHRCGAAVPQQAVVLSAEPVTEFITHDIALVSGLSALSAENPLTLYFAKLDDGGGQATTYLSIACTAGMVEPVQLSAQIKSRATLSVRIHHMSSDGDAVPFTVGTTAPTGPVKAPGYILGPVTFGSALGGGQSFSLDWGYQILKNTGESGKPYPTVCYCAQQEAMLTASIHDLAYATANRIHLGSIETTVTAQFRLLSAAAALPANSGGYLVTAAKAQVTIDSIAGADGPSSLELRAAVIEDSAAYLTFAPVA